MLLLGLRFIKDAARAVKRICREEFHKVKDAVLTELLGISCLIVSMYALRHEGEEEVLHLWCIHRNEIGICPKCGASVGSIHEEKQRCVRHLDIWGKKTFIHFLSRRFECKECGNIFTEELKFVGNHRRQTIAFELNIFELCKSNNRKSIAIKEGLSQSVVKDILVRWGKLRNKSNSEILTRILGIDEISLKKRHKQFVLVISDIERKCVLDILPNREKDTLSKWIDGLSVEQKKTIRYASMDMWKPYAQAVREKLSKAKIVIDRFHVMKQLNEQVNKVRKKVQDNENNEVKKVLKGSRWILVKNKSELTVKEEKQLKEILNICSEIRAIYLLKEEFRNIFEKIKDRDKAERFLRIWKLKAAMTGNKFLLKFCGTIGNWWKEILNYFLEGVSNGYVEGQNNAIRNIIRRAYGYRNFENFKVQVFTEHGFPTNL